MMFSKLALIIAGKKIFMQPQEMHESSGPLKIAGQPIASFTQANRFSETHSKNLIDDQNKFLETNARVRLAGLCFLHNAEGKA
jgi:hypothetical protein